MTIHLGLLFCLKIKILMPNSSAQPAPDPLAEVDLQDLKRFLLLIRESYPKADLATLFLEQNSPEPTVNVAAIANLRDVLSHFATFLRPSLPPDKRKEQLVNATEHLRRAILEPYEITYREHLKTFMPLHEQYIKELLPVRGEHSFLIGAPNRENIDSRLRAIHDLAAKGRLAKGNNDWLPDWEAGVGCYLQAFTQLKQLIAEVQDYYFKLKSHEKIVETQDSVRATHKSSVKLHYAGIVVAFILYVLADNEFHFTANLKALLAASWRLVSSIRH